MIVEGQEHCSIQSRYFSGFFDLRNQVLFPSRGQELGSFAEKDKNIVRLPIRHLSINIEWSTAQNAISIWGTDNI